MTIKEIEELLQEAVLEIKRDKYQLSEIILQNVINYLIVIEHNSYHNRYDRIFLSRAFRIMSDSICRRGLLKESLIYDKWLLY